MSTQETEVEGEQQQPQQREEQQPQQREEPGVEPLAASTSSFDTSVEIALGRQSTIGVDTGAAVKSVAPNTGGIAGGTAVTISGSNFTGATGATFGGNAATAFAVSNDTTITCTTPAHAAGAVPVVVTHPDGDFTLASGFTYS